MKLLRINNGIGEYYSITHNNYFEINNIDNEALLKIVDYIMENDEFELDDYNADSIKNNVQQTVYKEIHEKLSSLIKNKNNIISEINSKYENALKKYSQ